MAGTGEGADRGPAGLRDEDSLSHVSGGRGDQDTSESLDVVVALQVEKGACTWAILKQKVDGICWSIGQGWEQYLGNPHIELGGSLMIFSS